MLRWCWMQTLGACTVLMSLIVVASFFTLVADTQRVGIFVLIAWIGLAALSVWHAITIKNRYIELNAPQLNTPVRIVQISDVHIGSRSAAFLHKVVKQVNAEKPDLVFITGDLLDASSVGRQELAALADLTAPTYMCIGNHECYVDLNKALRAIESHGVTVLRDAKINSHGMQIIGIDDREKPDSLPEIIETLQLDPTAYSVLLYHRPDGWQAALERNIDLTLSGHTHAGQMFPFGLLVKRRYPQMAGLFSQAGKSLYVSVGTGTWGPLFRLGTQSEMTVIDLLTNHS